MSPPCSDFTVATTSWMPDLSSSFFDFASMSLRLAADMTPAWSTTRPVSGGKSKAKANEVKQSATNTPSVIPGRAKHEPESTATSLWFNAVGVHHGPVIMDSGLLAALGPGMTGVDQNFTCGGFSEPSLAVNSAIGLLPANAVFAQITVGKVRSAVL